LVVHPFFLYEIHRQHMSELERKAALQRMFMEGYDPPRIERKRRFRLFTNGARRSESAQGHTLRKDAYACR
jgi:hypothetical protein